MNSRQNYRLFSEGQIAGLRLPNSLVRSATWDPCLFAEQQMTEEVLDIYRKLAVGGVGLIITGSFPVGDASQPGESGGYAALAIRGVEQMAEVVHQARDGCKVVAQLDINYQNLDPSGSPSPFRPEPSRTMTLDEIAHVERNFITAIAAMKAAGYDGVQLHAAHGTLLSRFLSPIFNRRKDRYGGSPEKRIEIVRRIVAGARQQVGDFPVLIKANATDYLEGGLDLESFPPTAAALAGCGIDAIEVSGGQWECLTRSEAELGFRPVPSPEGHTRLNRPEQESYFLPFAEALDIPIPVILVGGNRDAERAEAVLQGGKVDFIALCRPLIHEPDLPQRWLEGSGSSQTGCIACNACIYDMLIHPGRENPGPIRCVYQQDRELFHASQKWLSTWVEKFVIAG